MISLGQHYCGWWWVGVNVTFDFHRRFKPGGLDQKKRLRCHSDSGLCTFRLRQSTLQFLASSLVYWSHRWPKRSTETGPALISCESYCHLVVSGTPWSINQSLPCIRGRREQLWSNSKYRVGALGWKKSAKTEWVLVKHAGWIKKTRGPRLGWTLDSVDVWFRCRTDPFCS